MLLKKAWSPPKKRRKTEYKDRKTQNCAGLDAGTAVLWRMATHAPAHGWACVQARLAVRPLCRLCLFCLGCTAVHPCRTPVSCAVSLYFSILYTRDFLKPLTFFKIALEVFFSIETRWFLLKWRQNAFWAQYESKEGNLTIYSTRCNKKRMRKRDQIWAKIGSNKGLTPRHLDSFIYPEPCPS